MFQEHLNEILLNLLPAREVNLASAQEWESVDRSVQMTVRAAADHAARWEITPLTVMTKLRAPTEFIRQAQERRRRLGDLVLGQAVLGGEKYLPKIADIAVAIAEETTWAQTDAIAVCPGGEVDSAAAETGVILAWTLSLARTALSHLSPHIPARMETGLYQQLLIPFAETENEQLFKRRDGSTAVIAARLLAAFLLADADDTRRWAGIRKAILLLDDCLGAFPEDGTHILGLEAWQETALAVCDAMTLLFVATGGSVDLRGEKRLTRMRRYPLAVHLGGGEFFNPNGRTHLPVTGEALFRMGESIGSDALCALGAYVYDFAPDAVPEAGMTARIMNALTRRALMAEPKALESAPVSILPDAMNAVMRGEAFACALGGGSIAGHRDAGDFVIYYRGKPVFTDLGGKYWQAACHSLPAIGEITPTAGRGGAKDLETGSQGEYTYVAVNLAPGFPLSAGVASWQRTLMLLRRDRTVRIIEAFDLTASHTNIAFHFITPDVPEPAGEKQLRLGRTCFSWTDALTPSVEPIGENWRIVLTLPGPTRGGNFSFTLTACD